MKSMAMKMDLPEISPRVSFTGFHNVVDGRLRDAQTTYHGINPATSEKLWPVPVATESDLEDAVKAARHAFNSWAKVTIEGRKRLVEQWIEKLKSHEADFTDLLIHESGKPRMIAKLEVKGSCETAIHSTTLSLPTETIEEPDRTIVSKYVPLGIVGAICPWNFPLALAIQKVSPALIAGNCVILKPSPFTPYSALKLGEIAINIFPPGVFQVLGGDEKLGPWITHHPDIQKISFTGSIPTGKRIMRACADTLKRVTLELGGNDASIVCPDVDIATTAPALVMGAMFNSGQLCLATKRIYIHEYIYEPMVKAMGQFAATLKVGEGNEEGVMMGPIQNEVQFDRVRGFLKEGKDKGWKYAAGGELMKNEKGYFVTPTIVDNPPNDSRIIQEEPFGPIVPTQSWTDESEVIARANNTDFGLGACVWSKDVSRAIRIGQQLEAGSVFINSSEKPTLKAAISGFKQSGIGFEGGSQALTDYCNIQVMYIYK